MIKAIKYGDEETWRSLFADWFFELDWRANFPPLWDAEYRQSTTFLESGWRHSRKIILDQVHDARIARTSRPEVIHEPGTGDEIPKIEQARVIVDHIGLVDGTYRTFTDLTVRRVWDLQRVDGGPWRIREAQHL